MSEIFNFMEMPKLFPVFTEEDFIKPVVCRRATFTTESTPKDKENLYKIDKARRTFEIENCDAPDTLVIGFHVYVSIIRYEVLGTCALNYPDTFMGMKITLLEGHDDFIEVSINSDLGSLFTKLLFKEKKARECTK
jgi:hypothetical protein